MWSVLQTITIIQAMNWLLIHKNIGKWKNKAHKKFHFLGKPVYICFLYYFTQCRLNWKVTASFETPLILTGHLVLPNFYGLNLIHKSQTFSSNTITYHPYSVFWYSIKNGALYIFNTCEFLYLQHRTGKHFHH